MGYHNTKSGQTCNALSSARYLLSVEEMRGVGASTVVVFLRNFYKGKTKGKGGKRK